MFKHCTPSDRLADTITDCQVSLAVAAGCSAIGFGGLVANAISPGTTIVDGLLFVGFFYAALALVGRLTETEAKVKP